MNTNDLSEILNLIQSSPNCDRLTAALLKSAADSAALKSVKNKPNTDNDTKQKNYLKFTRQEVEQMPETIKQILLIYNGNAVTYRYHNGCFETRYRRDGYYIQVYAADLKSLKAKFMDKITHYKPTPKEDKRFPYMKDFIDEWLKIKQVTLKDSTYKSYVVLINTHVLPAFGEKRINLITRADIQSYLTELVKQEKNRTAQKLKQLLSAIFDVAAEDYNIKTPMTKIALPHYEVKKGSALTKAEEKKLVNWCISHKDSSAASALLVLLYTGMRVGEVKTAKLYDNYIECETEKIRKGYAKVFRKIPLSPMYRKVMKHIDFDKATHACHGWIKDKLNEIFDNAHHPHELRYTFITRAKEAGCNQELVMLWDGHKFDSDVRTSAVDRGYTTYSMEYMLIEIKKIDYDL